MKTLKNLQQPLYDETDKPVLRGETAWTLKSALVHAMIETPHHDPGPISADEKLARYTIFRKLQATESEITLAPEDVALLKKAAGQLYTPLFYGQIVEHLNAE